MTERYFIENFSSILNGQGRITELILKRLILMYKEKLIKYVQAKNGYIKSMTDIDYVTKEDIDDIMSWEEEECEQIWKKLDLENEADSCPWCIKNYIKYTYLNCERCNYGHRHGKCTLDNSRIGSINNKENELGLCCILISDEIIEIYNKINNEE